MTHNSLNIDTFSERSLGAKAHSDTSLSSSDNIVWKGRANTDSKSVIRFGFWSVGAGMILFLLWAVLFPLSSAVITPGTFVSQGKNKVIQHSSGGRVTEILVVEGQGVAAGDAIMTLDTSQAKAELTRLQARHASLSALRARLDSERSGGLRRLDFSSNAKQVSLSLRGVKGPSNRKSAGLFQGAPSTLRDGFGASIELSTPKFDKLVTNSLSPSASDLYGDEMVESQRDAYVSGRKVLSEEVESLRKKAETLQKQKDGLLGRAKAQHALLQLARNEYARLKPLARQGYIARRRLDERERSVLELTGSVTALDLDALAVETQISEVRIQIRKARSENSDVAAREYTKTVGQLAEISDQLIAARQVVAGSIIRSPASGILSQLAITTIGGVVGAGERIGEVVPADAPLIVQARVSPGDVDYVQVNQTADIAVTAFNRRIDDMLVGRVIYKSADAEKDEKTGDSYFIVRLKMTGVKGNGRSRIGDIHAGMQSEVYIHTGSRTFLTYLAKPMIDSFRRAFREQ